MARGKPARPRIVPNPPPTEGPEVVDPAWIVKAVGAVLALGLLCSYVTLCAFFYTGQWQFVLNPSRTVGQTPASQQLGFQDVRFGDDLSGHPQLTGWWIPSDAPSDPTVLMLHNQNGSMSDAVPIAKALHEARLNVLLFDYRGYGKSGGEHPTERTMQADANAAFLYLTESQKVPVSRILVFGGGLGASLATKLCGQKTGLSGLILLDADGDTTSRVVADQRSRIIPVGLLFHERFPLADALHSLVTPKLLISFTEGNAPIFAQRAADPKITAELDPHAGAQAITPAVRRFLDTYISRPAAPLAPAH